MNCIIVIHVAILDGYKERLLNFINLINRSGLITITKNIYICSVGNYNEIDLNDLMLDNKKIILKHVSNDISVYELYTLQFLYEYAKELREEDCNILYLHTKGVGRENNECIEDWIKYLCYFNIIKWKDCINYLLEYKTCGIDLRDFVSLHYSGNFWWAKASHIRTLIEPIKFTFKDYPNSLNSERHNQEFWVCYDKNLKNHKSMWDCGIPCLERHRHRYTSDKYIM